METLILPQAAHVTRYPHLWALLAFLFENGARKWRHFCALVETQLHKTLSECAELDKKKEQALAHVHGCPDVSSKDILEVLPKALVSSDLINEEPIFSPFTSFMAKLVVKLLRFANVSISGIAHGRGQQAALPGVGTNVTGLFS